MASAGLYEQDGTVLAEGRPWPDAEQLVWMFWAYYARLIEPSYHGRALRALRTATPFGVKTFKGQAEFIEAMRATLGPFVKKHTVGRSDDECRWCTRPGVNVGEQCQGCGAWRRA